MDHYNSRVPTTFDYVPMLHDVVQGFNRNLLNTNFYSDAVYPHDINTIKKVIESRTSKIKIITLFRDPIARNLSIIFEAMSTLWIDTEAPYKNFNHWNDLLNYWIQYKIKPYSMIAWFDEQLNDVFNINILDYTFDAKAGYTIIENDHVECLILRTDKIDLNHQTIRNFCDLPELTIKKHNTAKDKWYDNLYQSFMKTYKPTAETIQMLYDNPITQ